MRCSDVGGPGGRLRKLVVMVVAAVLLAPASAHAAAYPYTSPAKDPFYAYTGEKPLADIAPGTVLKTRTSKYHVAGVASKVEAVQLLYRSTDQLGRPVTNVTSVLRPAAAKADAKKLLGYMSFYDSLNPADQPSFAIAGGVTFGGTINAVEALFVAPFLNRGYTVTVPDTEGQDADFAAGPEYGMLSLDGIRATLASSQAGVAADAKVGMLGYSGGAIAAQWAAELAPKYAPDVDKLLVGTATGGVMVNPAHNLHYIDGSKAWAGVLGMAVVGIARSFDIDLQPYLNENGQRLYTKLKYASIANVLGQYPGLTWAKMTKPEFSTPESVPIYVTTVNKLIMGSYGTPSSPLFIGQGANGQLEGTKPGPEGIGGGDGVMVAGDVRALARQYCDKGVKVQYVQYDKLSHFSTMLAWFNPAVTWMTRRFAGQEAPQNCATIAPGNSLAPIPEG